MHVLKQLGRILSSAVFKLSVVLLAITGPLAMTFGTPGSIKTSLADSGIYDRAVDSAFDNLQQESGGTGKTEDGVPLGNKAIQKAAKEAFPPDVLQRSTEEALDGTYTWLHGNAEQPDFRIDLSDAKQRLATSIADQAVGRIKSLPDCTLAQLRTLNLNDIDPFDLPCRPPGLNLSQERKRYIALVASSEYFLKDPVITADTLKGSDGQSVFDHASGVPDAFRWSQRLPWISLVLAVVSGVGTVLLHDNRRRGLTIIARSLLMSGVLMLIGSLVTLYLLGNTNFGQKTDVSADLQDSLASIVRSVGSTLNRLFLVFAAAYSVLGGGALLWLRMTRPPSEQEEHLEHSKPDTEAGKPGESSAPGVKPEKIKSQNPKS